MAWLLCDSRASTIASIASYEMGIKLHYFQFSDHMKLSVVVVALYIQKLRYSSSTMSKPRVSHTYKGGGGAKKKSWTLEPQIPKSRRKEGFGYINL